MYQINTEYFSVWSSALEGTGFVLVLWHQSDCVGILSIICEFEVRYGMVSFYHVWEVWLKLIAVTFSFIPGLSAFLFCCNFYNISYQNSNLGWRQSVHTKISILESWWLLCADCSVLLSSRANIYCRLRIPLFVNYLQQVAVIYFL